MEMKNWKDEAAKSFERRFEQLIFLERERLRNLKKILKEEEFESLRTAYYKRLGSMTDMIFKWL